MDINQIKELSDALGVSYTIDYIVTLPNGVEIIFSDRKSVDSFFDKYENPHLLEIREVPRFCP